MDCCVQTDIEVARLDFFSVLGHGTISTLGCMTEVGRGNAIVPPSDLDIKHAAMAGQGHVQGVHKVLAVRSKRERGKKRSTSRFRMQIGLVTCNLRDEARRGEGAFVAITATECGMNYIEPNSKGSSVVWEAGETLGRT